MSLGRILIVDDEPQVRRVLRTALIAHGYEVGDARSGEEALQRLSEECPDVVLLDLNLPGMGGIQSCRAIRAGSQVPIIVISVRRSEGDKIEALDAGADDYLTKPFGVEELAARIRAVDRRHSATPREALHVLVLDGTVIDFETRQVIKDDQTTHLTAKEYELLRHLTLNAGKVVPHRRLLQAVWGPDYGDEFEYLRVFINQLRKKVEPDPARPRYITTEPCVGYRLVLPENTSRRRSGPSTCEVAAEILRES
jgi:two-component system KDP operon response regulator KdpE